MVEEKIKRMELAEVQRQIMEESLLEEQYQCLDKQAQEALSKKEELLREQENQRRKLDEEAEMALKAKETITRQLMLQRKLKKKEMELEKAALITSFLKEDASNSAQSRPPSKCEFNLRPSPKVMGALTNSQGDPGPLYSIPPARATPPTCTAAVVGSTISTSLPLAQIQHVPQVQLPTTESLLTQS